MPEAEFALLDCISSEEQAIAIYQAECWLLSLTAVTERRRKTLETCRRILIEEKEHRIDIGAHVSESATHRLTLAGSRLFGFALGGFLSTLPSRLNWSIHVWAERQAAEVYRKATDTLSDKNCEQTLLQSLKKAEEQEIEHSLAFKNLASAFSSMD